VPSDSPVVLIVEDEAIILLNAVDELERAGLAVLEAMNAARALQILEARPDITHVFSDIDLPGAMDGLQLASIVRQRWPAVNIILTSGHMLSRTMELPTGVAFFAKPYDLRDVLRSIL
jgi:CheY-like chemotaxis protein